MSWEETTLGELLSVKHGWAFKSQYFEEEGPYVLVTPGNFFEKGGFKLRPDKDRSYSGGFSPEYLLAEGDLIIAMTEQGPGLLGSAAVIPESARFLHNQRIGLISVKDDSSAFRKYLYYLFNTLPVRGQISGSATGTKVRHTAPERIYRVQVKIPDLPTQERIAAILSAYDDLIENNRRRIALLERAARLLYREWFVHFRFPGHKTVKFVDELPEGWRMMKVENAVRRQPPGLLYSQKTALPQGDVPILDQGQSGIIGYHNSEPSFEASLDNPVIVFANHTCYQRIIHFPFSAIQNVLPFKPSEKVPDQIYWLHHATLGLVNLNAYKGHWPEFKIKEFIVPTEELAEIFSKNVSPMHLEIQKLSETNEKLTKTRDLLLPRLMDGRIPVKV